VLPRATKGRTLSDRQIAEHCGVSQQFVSKPRGELSYNGCKIRQVTRGGTTYEQDTANIGKSPASRKPAAGLRWSLRPRGFFFFVRS